MVSYPAVCRRTRSAPSLGRNHKIGVTVTMSPGALRRHKEYCNSRQSATRFFQSSKSVRCGMIFEKIIGIL
jgi:hypothetical protein